MIEIRKLAGGAFHPELAHLTYPRFRHHLDGRPSTVPEDLRHWPISDALVALDDTGAAGLALLGRSADNRARLLSIMVSSVYRRRGIGALLLEASETLARGYGADRITAAFGSQKQREAFCGLVRKCGWALPVMLEFRIAGRADWTTRMGPDWEIFLQRLQAKGYSTTPWIEIDETDRAHADQLRMEQRDLIIDYQPYEQHSDPAISVAIRRHGELVGYILGQSLEGQDHHLYTTGYVSRPLQRAGWLIAGLDDVCRRQSDIYGPDSIAVYETPGNNPRMIEFMRRRLGPDALWMNERHEVQKVLE